MKELYVLYSTATERRTRRTFAVLDSSLQLAGCASVRLTDSAWCHDTGTTPVGVHADDTICQEEEHLTLVVWKRKACLEGEDMAGAGGGKKSGKLYMNVVYSCVLRSF